MSQEYRTQVEQVSAVGIPALALLEDNFEATLNKWNGEQSGGLFGGLFAGAAFNGNQSYRLQTRSVGAVNLDYQGMMRFLGLTPKNKLNTSCRIQNFATNSRGGEIQFSYTFRLGLVNKTFEVRFIQLTNQLFIRDSTNTMVAVAGYTLANFDDIWTRLEIQINLVTGQYEYIAVGNKVISLAGISAYSVVSATHFSDLAFRLRSVQSEGAGAIGTDLRIDDLLITNPD